LHEKEFFSIEGTSGAVFSGTVQKKNLNLAAWAQKGHQQFFKESVICLWICDIFMDNQKEYQLFFF